MNKKFIFDLLKSQKTATVLFVKDSEEGEYWFCRTFTASSSTQELTEFNTVVGICLQDFYGSHGNHFDEQVFQNYVDKQGYITYQFSNKIEWHLFKNKLN